jgi:hypothetical protein
MMSYMFLFAQLANDAQPLAIASTIRWGVDRRRSCDGS